MFENWTGRGIESTADGLVVAIFARSTDTFTCSVRNLRLGYGAQAAMLNRSLFEDMADAHWIVTDPETAESRYREHHQHGRMLLADTVASFPEMYPHIDLPEFDPEERARLNEAFGPFGHKPGRASASTNACNSSRIEWTDRGRPARALRFMHALAHRENNQTLHVSAQSLGSVVERRRERSARVPRRRAPGHGAPGRCSGRSGRSRRRSRS